MDLAAAIDACRAEIARLHAMDRGNGLDAPEEFRLSKATNRLQRLLAEQPGFVITNRRSAPPKLVKHRKAKKKTWADVVPNACHCERDRFRAECGATAAISLENGRLSFAPVSAVLRPPAKPQRAKSAYDLCSECQVSPLFWLAVGSGKHPADFVNERHWFEPTEDDRDQLDWVCLLNASEWLGRDGLLRYSGREPAPRLPLPRCPYRTVPSAEQYAAFMAEVHAVESRNRAIDATEQAAADAVEITESTFMDFLTNYRSRA